MIELFARRRLERMDLAALRVDPGHHVLDRAVFAGGIHRLKDQQHRPSILRVETLLQVGHLLAPLFEHFVAHRLEALAPGVGGIDVFQAKARTVSDAVSRRKVGR